MSHEHIKFTADCTFLCENCGETYTMNMPCPFNLLLDAKNGWVKDHENCEKEETEGG